MTSTQVAATLQDHFPDFEVQMVDVTSLIRRHKEILLANGFYTVKEYWQDILSGHKRFNESFFRTPYLFQQIRKLISRRLAGQEYAFTFQMQSLYDTSLKNTPHFIYTDHTNLANLYYTGFEQNKLYAPAWIELEKSIYRRATLIFTRSSNISRSLVEQYCCPADQVVCVYAGSNATALCSNGDGPSYGSKNILFVGIDWERKGGPELVEAFKKVLVVHPDARLTIVGCSPPINVPNCEVVGWVPLEQVSRYYQQAAVFCLPTKLEPFGIAFIEALSARLPVVATDIGAIPDFVNPGENGYLVRPNDVDGLAAALIDLIGNPDRCRAFGEQGYRIARERYTWEKVGDRMREQIEPVLRRASPKNSRKDGTADE